MSFPAMFDVAFKSHVMFVSVSLGAEKTLLTVSASVPDAKSECLVNGEKLKSEVPLNTSFTKIDVDVTSPDGTGKAVCIEVISYGTDLNFEFTQK